MVTPTYEYIVFGICLGVILTLDGVFIVSLIKNRNRQPKRSELPLVYRNAPQRGKK